MDNIATEKVSHRCVKYGVVIRVVGLRQRGMGTVEFVVSGRLFSFFIKNNTNYDRY